LRASIQMQHVGKQYTDNTENNRQNPDLRNAPGYIPLVVDPYTVVNLSFSYDLGRYLGVKQLELRMDVNNLFDRLYVTHGEGTDFFPAATRNIFLWAQLGL